MTAFVSGEYGGRSSRPNASTPQEQTSAPHGFRRFWQSALGYWKRGGPRCAWPLTISLAVVVVVSLSITYGLNLWNRHFFDALEARNGALALHQGLMFPLWIGAYLAMCVFAMWARMTMQRTWRAYLNDNILDRWLDKNRYYRLECVGTQHKNPEYRIADDLRIATEMPVDFVTGFATAVLSALTFFAVLWSVGGAITVPLAGGVVIPGFMVWAAVIYAVIANGSMLLIARRFIPMTERKNQTEAEYRYALTRVRENAESIALLRGGCAERTSLDRSFGAVLARWRDLVGQHMRSVIISQGSAQLCGIVPVLLCTPRFIDGSMTLGQIMQIASAFTIVQSALSWLVDNYTRVADWTASARRVASLLSELDRIERSDGPQPQQITQRETQDGALELRGLSVALAGGGTIVQNVDARIQQGEKVLLVGDSGAGKSLLVRAISGCWPWGQGEIGHGHGSVCVVPQRPYLPIGTLRAAVTYPLSATEVPEQELIDAITAVGLAPMLPQLDREGVWSNTLSEGEKQRLAFARLLIHKPDVVILDEATSALHVGGQAELMQLVSARLPHATIISVAHRPELEAFHDRKLTLQAGPRGATLVSDHPIGPTLVPHQGYAPAARPRVVALRDKP